MNKGIVVVRYGMTVIVFFSCYSDFIVIDAAVAGIMSILLSRERFRRFLHLRIVVLEEKKRRNASICRRLVICMVYALRVSLAYSCI